MFDIECYHIKQSYYENIIICCYPSWSWILYVAALLIKFSLFSYEVCLLILRCSCQALVSSDLLPLFML